MKPMLYCYLRILQASEQEFANDADKEPAYEELELISCHPTQGHQMFPLSSTPCLGRGQAGSGMIA